MFLQDAFSGVYHQVAIGGDGPAFETECLADPPFYLIPDDGIAYFSRNGQTEPGMIQLIGNSKAKIGIRRRARARKSYGIT